MLFSEMNWLDRILFLKRLKGESGVEKIVTGNPIHITDALADKIKSLILSHATTQDGTPTPSAPVDIVCNNGALRMVDDELPGGYKRLVGITFDGNLRYETGEALMGSDDVTMTLDNLSSSGKNVFGSYNGTNEKNFSLYVYGSTSGSYFRYGDQPKRPKYGGTGQRTITFGKSGTSGFAENSTVDPDEFTTPANTYIGMLPSSSSAAFTGDVIGSITVSNRLEWIPTERETDGVIGYYEKYNGNFIAPTGSGTPVSLGYDTSHLTVLSVVGTPEVLAVSGGNIFNKADESSCGGYYVDKNGKIAVASSNLTAAIRCLPNTTYYGIHKSGRGGGRMFTVSTEEWAVGDIANEMQGSAFIAANTVFSYTTQADAKWLFVCFGRSTSGMPSFAEQTADFMLSLTPISAETEYVGYSGLPQTASVVNLYAVGNVKDEQDIISGVVTRRCGIKVLDDTENVEASGAGWAIPIDDKTRGYTDRLWCSHYSYTSKTMSSAPDKSIRNYTSKNIGIKDSAFTSAEDAKAFFAAEYAAGHPVIVVYELNEETTEQVTAQPLNVYSGSTVVQAGSGTDITMTYKAKKP